ncbi:hypothetical protein [Bacillus sp. RB3]|uniref:hypothetical protein n=1 Tax=Bacillus sp. RB3 TaxID=3050012 RepID=UPI0025402163|nr:hypothetical protein [Bacillus sp. RB3]MDK3014199.1 hypothetical protein [Bacillus sp. RB3]
MLFEGLLDEWRTKDINFVVDVVEKFCIRNNLNGIDGINGLLSYVKKIIANEKFAENKPLLKSFGETAYTLWALDKLENGHLADTIAKNMVVGGDFGETGAYQSGETGNYFRNFELQLAIAVRLLEGGLSFNEGGEGEPDFILNTGTFVVEVKAPASKLALLQNIIKAVKQIEMSGKKGVIIVVLDHMVVRNMVQGVMEDLPIQIQDIILSVLPQDPDFNTIGVIAEWVNWEEDDQHLSTVQPIMSNYKFIDVENREIIKKVWQALSIDDISEFPILHRETQNSFNYNKDLIQNIDISREGKEFYQSIWGED